jgi:WSC domain.
MRPLRDLPKRFTRYATTPETCVRECQYQNYKFAGVQYGYLCFCGNAFGRYGSLPDNDCNSECQGDGGRKCGGYYHNSVYSTG